MPTPRTRFDRRRFDAKVGLRSDHPLTVFLVPASEGKPPGRRVCSGGFALGITFDPADVPVKLPPGGPHKIILGPEMEV